LLLQWNPGCQVGTVVHFFARDRRQERLEFGEDRAQAARFETQKMRDGRMIWLVDLRGAMGRGSGRIPSP
jgi:hypothetical protein